MLYICETTGPTFVPRIHASRKANINNIIYILPLLPQVLLMNQYDTLDPVSLVGSVQYICSV